MEHYSFSYYFAVLKKQFLVLVMVSLVAALVAYGLVNRIKPQYEVHYSYVVALAQRDSSAVDFRFDGYYALQATDLFTTTLASLTTTPETIVAAYNEAGILLPGQDPRQLSKAILAQKTAPQLVQVTVKDESQVRAEALAKGLQKVVAGSVDKYQAQGIPAVKFTVTPTDAWTGLTSLPTATILVATFILVLFLAVNAVLLYASFRAGI